MPYDGGGVVIVVCQHLFNTIGKKAVHDAMIGRGVVACQHLFNTVLKAFYDARMAEALFCQHLF